MNNELDLLELGYFLYMEEKEREKEKEKEIGRENKKSKCRFKRGMTTQNRNRGKK